MNYPWKRYWVKQGENPSMDGGFFAEPQEGLRWFHAISNGVRLLDLRNVPCLVLLGDVGMGKSTTLHAEAELLKAALAGQKHAVLYEDLKRLSETQIERRIFQSPAVTAWLQGEHGLTLFLDSLDECWRRIDALEHLLVDEFERQIRGKTPPLFLRLTCRSAEWRGEAGKTLERLFSNRAEAKPPVQTYVLAPLSAENIRTAAQVSNLDGERLLERIVTKGAEALASHPITFKMLLEIYRERGDFPASRAELYREGCLQLCADEHVVFGASRQRKTTPQQRLRTACRLATLSVFTNRFLINGDLEHPASRPDVLEAADAIGYAKEQAGGARFVVDRDTITETLQTALFAERIEGAQPWRHQSYAEFLAADYVKQRGLPVAQVVSLLADTTTNTQRVIPQLEETACWMAEMFPQVFAALATKNADILLRCDSTYWNHHDRALLVESYLDLVRRHQAPELDWQLKHRLARLAHPGLANQISPVIANRSEDPLARETAIDMAGYCRVVKLAPELIDVFLDPSDVFRVRKHAAIALEQIANDEVRSLLKQRNVSTWEGDMDDDLKGYFLQMMWPSHMSFSELLPLAMPKQGSYTGSYKIFLQYKLPTSLSEADLPKMLDWLRETEVSFDIIGPFGYLPSKVFARALIQMDVPPIRDAVLRLLASDEHRLHYLFGGKLAPEEIGGESRLRFWEVVVGSDLDIGRLVSYGDLRRTRMLSSEDLSSFIAKHVGSTEPSIRSRWRMLVFSVFSAHDPVALELLSNLARTDATVDAELAVLTSCRILPEGQNWMKQDYERERARHQSQAEKAHSLEELIISALNAFDAGRTWAFWKVCELLHCDPDNLNAGMVLWATEFSAGKAWKSLGAEVQRRILCAATVYLRTQEVEEAMVWDTHQSYRPYDALNPILVLLYDEDWPSLTALTNEDWSKWSGVLFSYSSRRNGGNAEAYRTILSIAHSKAPQAFVAALARYLTTQINDDSERRIIWHINCVWCADIKRVFIDLLYKRPLKPSAAQDVLQLILSQEPQEGMELLTSYIEELNSPEVCNINVPSAVVVVLTNFPDTWSVRLLDQMMAVPALGRAVIPHILRGYHQPAGWLSKVPPRSLAAFWEWLNQQYPGDPYERDNGGGEVTIAHDIYHFRNGVFQTLIELGTLEACSAMAELMQRHPDQFWLGDILAQMRKTCHRKGWARPSPSALLEAFSKADKWLVRTDGELQALVIEALRRFESDLHGAPPSMELWNETTKGQEKFWQPKDERNLSSCLKRFLERDLPGWGILADREVEICPRRGDDPAQLVDILVEAIPVGEDGQPGSPLRVVIEVKCAWNKGVCLDMERQLFDRYLKNSQMHFGIYVVAYFTCNAWNWENDARKNSGESQTVIDDLRQTLAAQAASLTGAEKRVESIVIDARLGPA